MDAEPIRILLIGSGGREHALAWKLSQSARVEVILVVPGNGGIAHESSKVWNISSAVQPNDYPGLVAFAKLHDVNLVIPGPEAPLVDGIEGFFREGDSTSTSLMTYKTGFANLGTAGIRCFGPSKAAARMEGSKTFAKDFMTRHHIPTAKYENFSSYETAKVHLESVPYKVVIKASGLAGGKGVLIPSTKEEARTALQSLMVSKEFGSAGQEIVIEEYLEGDELSLLSFSDGVAIRSLPAAQDHKAVFDNDKGPNTGGMGCYAPAPLATPHLIDEIHRTILQPTVDGMRKEGSQC